MERMLRRRFAPSRPQAKRNKVNLIRYADDFVVTGASKELLEKARTLITDFLQQRGLTLSEEKTKIVHIEEGFDFLGCHLHELRPVARELLRGEAVREQAILPANQVDAQARVGGDLRRDLPQFL